jgi:hypothetical protein
MEIENIRSSAIQQQMDVLHQKWRDTYPTYPLKPEISKAIRFDDGVIVHVDVSIHENIYCFAIVVDPMNSTCIRVKINVFPEDDIERVISYVVYERYRRLKKMMELIKHHVLDIPIQQTLLQKFNMLEGAMVLKDAKTKIHLNYPYMNAPSEVIEDYYIQYIQQKPEKITVNDQIADFTFFFYENTKTEKWIIPEPDLEDEIAI